MSSIIISFTLPPIATYSPEQRFCLKSAQTAAKICLSSPTRTPYIKQDNTPVTAADLAIQLHISTTLSTHFPNDHLIAEEDLTTLFKDRTLHNHVENLLPPPVTTTLPSPPRHQQQRFWTLDPIDGTRGYLSDISYATGLALLDDSFGPPPVAVLALPAQRIVLLASNPGHLRILDGEGRDASADGIAPPHEACRTDVWHLSGVADLKVDGWAPWTRLCCGSLVKYAAVARGAARTFVYVRKRGGEALVWDHAAGVAAVIAAGGRVSECRGGCLNVGTGFGRRFVDVEGGCDDEVVAFVATGCGVNHERVCREVWESLRTFVSDGREIGGGAFF